MHLIIDKICLHDAQHRAAFEQWVRDVDYAACHQLPSVQRFQVVRVTDAGDCDYFEVVQVSSMNAFEADMQTPVFRALVARFTEMAEVTASFNGTLIPPGFARHG